MSEKQRTRANRTRELPQSPGSRTWTPWRVPPLPRCSMSCPAATLPRVTPPLRSNLGANCSASCEGIFGRRPLMTAGASPPAPLSPRRIYWLLSRVGGQEVRLRGPGRVPDGQRKGRRPGGRRLAAGRGRRESIFFFFHLWWRFYLWLRRFHR